MEKNKVKLLKHPLVILVSFFILLFLYSKFGPNLPISVLTQEKGQPLVVSGEGKASAVPDIAKVNLGIEVSGVSLNNVQKEANTQSKSLVDTLKKLGIAEKDIKTTAYNVFPEYDYQSTPAKITGYRVSTNYEVKITNLDKVNEILASATSAGATSIGGVSFEVNEETKDKLMDEARKEAITEAKKKAEGLAKAAGITLGKIINIAETQTNEPRPIPLAAGGAVKEIAPASQIAPGETEFSVSVSLTFEIR